MSQSHLIFRNGPVPTVDDLPFDDALASARRVGGPSGPEYVKVVNDIRPSRAWVPVDDQGEPTETSIRETITPREFLAVGNGIKDDSDALQAFFDHAQVAANARRYLYDWSGRWLVTRTIYANFAPIDEVQRTMICGCLVFPATSSMPGGVPVEYGIFISGSRSVWMGQLCVQCETVSNYNSRPFHTGIMLASVAQAQFAKMAVIGSRRDAVRCLDGYTTLTVRSGHQYERTYAGNNNIGLAIEYINARYCGSTERSPTISHSMTLTSFQNGNNAGLPSIPFEAVTSGHSAGPSQAAQLTVNSTSNLRVGDYVKLAHLLTPTQYGTLECVNATGKIIRSNGNWVTDGLAIGDRYAILSGPAAGEYEVTLALSTELTVYPKPPDAAAHAPTGMMSRWLYYPISSIDSSTLFTVYGWIPTRITAAKSTPVWLSAGFAFRVSGGDTANITIGTVIGFVCGGAIWSAGLYGGSFGMMLAEFSDIGLLVGAVGGSSVNFGTQLDNFHAENVDYNVLQVAPGSLKIFGSSSYNLSRIWDGTRRYAVTDLEPTVLYGLRETTLDIGGTLLATTDVPHRDTGMNSFYFQDGSFSNHPAQRDRTLLANTATVVIGYNQEVDRLAAGNSWARLRWLGASGGVPTGTLTLELSDELTAKGWTLIGGGDITTGTVVEFSISYAYSIKKCVVHQIAGGANLTIKAPTTGGFAKADFYPNGQPWTQINFRNAAGAITGYILSGAGELYSYNDTQIFASSDTLTTFGTFNSSGLRINKGSLGYGVGTGGTVTQATSKSTGVTLNKACGQITTHDEALASGAVVTFVVANSLIAATDTIVATIKSGATEGAYNLTVDSVFAGGFNVSIRNLTGGSLGEAIVINFATIKASIT